MLRTLITLTIALAPVLLLIALWSLCLALAHAAQARGARRRADESR